MDDETIVGAVRAAMISANRRGLRKGYPYSDLVSEVAARLGLPEKTVEIAVNSEIGAGRLYWRNPRYPRRLKLAASVRGPAAEPVAPETPALW